MPFRRRLLRYGPSPDELINTLEDRLVAGCTFELYRLGGCGSGQLRLKDAFNDRALIGVGEWIACEYDDGERWYLGRVESRRSESPGGVTLQLEGMSVQLGEVFPGGFGSERDGARPHRYAVSDRFPDDPDRLAETVDDVERLEDIVRLLLQQYVVPATDIRVEAGAIEAAVVAGEVASFKVNGEESVRSLLKDLALRLRNAAWGVDELGQFFLLQARSATLVTFQEGVDLLELREEQSRAAVFNRVLLTGGYVYSGGAPGQLAAPAVRWRANYRQPASIDRFGERRLRVWVPWIRTVEDSRQFVREFFRVFAEPARKYTIEVAGVSECPRPWLGRVRILDRLGQELICGQPETVRVHFDNTPRLFLEIGPEDPRTHWPEPPHDERFPVLPSPLASGHSGGGGPLTLTLPSGASDPPSGSGATTSEPGSSDLLSSGVTSSGDLSSALTSNVFSSSEWTSVSWVGSETSSDLTSAESMTGTETSAESTSEGESGSTSDLTDSNSTASDELSSETGSTHSGSSTGGTSSGTSSEATSATSQGSATSSGGASTTAGETTSTQPSPGSGGGNSGNSNSGWPWSGNSGWSSASESSSGGTTWWW